MKHTPGTWDVVIDGRACFHDGNRVAITKFYDEGDSTVAEVWPAYGETDIADGRLIAAAPELLQALGCLANWHMRDGSPCFCPAGRDEDERKGKMPTLHSSACEFARAAIARAEGR